MLKYLWEILERLNDPRNFNTYIKAVRNVAYGGYLDCLIYLHWISIKLNYTLEGIYALAAEGGHIDCLIYASRNKIRWDDFACVYAAEYGHLECLQYLHLNGHYWDSNVSMLLEMDIYNA